ncbi:Uncharacterized protein QTN25_007967 [Entamoeba marina]
MQPIVSTIKREDLFSPSLKSYMDEYEWYFHEEVRPLLRKTIPTIQKCMNFMMPQMENTKECLFFLFIQLIVVANIKTFKFQLSDGTFQGVLQLNGWFCNDTEIRFQMQSWNKLPIFAKIRESQLIQMQEFYRKCTMVLKEVEYVKELQVVNEDLIQHVNSIIDNCSDALELLDNKPKHGLFPDYEPSLLFQEPQPPNNCILEIYIHHREFVIRAFGLVIQRIEVPTFSTPPPTTQSSVNRSVSATIDDLTAMSVEWGCGEGLMGYPQGTKQVLLQNKFPTVSYMYNGYSAMVAAKREVHINVQELDSICQDIQSMCIQWTHVLYNLKQLFLM